MKKKHYNSLLIAGCALSIFGGGCAILQPQKQVEEPEAPKKETRLLDSPNLDQMAMDDTSGRIAAAREAAERLIREAKEEAARIKQEADNIMAKKTYEAQKKAEDQLAAMKAELEKKQKDQSLAYLSQKKKEAYQTAQSIVEKANAEAQKIMTAAQKKADTLVSKYRKDAEKVSAKLLNDARKAAATITAKAAKDAEKIKKEAAKIMADADKYAADKKKEADNYSAKKIKKSDEEAKKELADLKVANQMLDQLLKGIKTNDYKLFSEHLSDDMKKIITPEKFKAMNMHFSTQFGDYISRTYIGRLQKRIAYIYMWKGRFSKVKKSDMVIRLAIAEIKGKTVIVNFSIAMI